MNSSLDSPLHLTGCADGHFLDVLKQIQEKLAATAASFDASGTFPHDNMALLSQTGLLALVAARPYGSQAGLGLARQAIAAVAFAEPATALVLTMTYLNHRQLGRVDCRWPLSLRQQVLESARTPMGGSYHGLINALRVEPELGSPARGGLPQTVAVRDGDGWRISGRKIYSTGSPALEWLAIWGRTDENPPRTGTFLIHRPTIEHGLQIIENWNHLGLRASGSHEVVLTDVWIPKENAVDIRLPEEWSNGASPTDLGANADQQAWMVVLLGTLYDAVARAGYEWLKDFLRNRVPASLGYSLATIPRIQEQVGEIEARLQTNRILLDDAAHHTDKGASPSTHASGLLKYTVTGNAIEVLEIALKITGNHGLSRNHPLERHYRDVLCSRIHTPQNDSSLVAAGREALLGGR